MKTLREIMTAAAASATIVALGCGHTDDRNVTTSANPPRSIGATNAQPRWDDALSVDRLSSARCDREQACDNVGGGKKYASRRVCIDQMRGSIGNDINSYKCPGGIDAVAAQRCQSAIGNEECGAHPVETLTRIDDCRAGAMCLK
jgi:hypothetical protein